MASLATLTTIAKQRPQFMATVVQAFETLHGKSIRQLYVYLFLLLNIFYFDHCV